MPHPCRPRILLGLMSLASLAAGPGCEGSRDGDDEDTGQTWRWGDGESARNAGTSATAEIDGGRLVYAGDGRGRGPPADENGHA